MINHLRREHALVSDLVQQLGTAWNTVWASIEPLLQAMADNEGCLADVRWFNMDEHVQHHVNEFPIEDDGRGPKQLIGMVDLTPDPDTDRLQVWLLGLIPGWSDKA